MNIKNLKTVYNIDSINDKCIDLFLKLKIFQYNIDNISYFKEHTEKEYLKYLYKNIFYYSYKGLFLGQLDEKSIIIYFIKVPKKAYVIKGSPFFPFIITDKNDKNIKFEK